MDLAVDGRVLLDFHSPMRFYIDIDDVLCETAATLCGLAERTFGKGVPYEKVQQFDLQRVFRLTDEEMARFMVLSHEPDCLRSYPETPGATAGVRALRAAGHTVEFVTGRPPSAHAATRDWLDAVGLGDIPVTYVDKYGRFSRQTADAPHAITLPELLARRYDVAIDDSPVVLPHLASWTDTHVLVMDRPWNADFILAPNMTRVRGWAAILAAVAEAEGRQS